MNVKHGTRLWLHLALAFTLGALAAPARGEQDRPPAPPVDLAPPSGPTGHVEPAPHPDVDLLDPHWDTYFGTSGTNRGLNGGVFAITDWNNKIYVGGDFTQTSDGTVTGLNGLARWTGRTWAPVGGGVSGSVYALEVYQGNLYVGGDFTEAGGVTVNGIACWDGTSWSALGSGVASPYNAVVRALHTWGEGEMAEPLYVGGNFTSANGMTVNNIAIWDGTQNQWFSISNVYGPGTKGVNGPVWALTDYANLLFIGGEFVVKDYLTANCNNLAVYYTYPYPGYMGKIAPMPWSGSVGGKNTGIPMIWSRICALTVHKGELYVGGRFGFAQNGGGAYADSACVVKTNYWDTNAIGNWKWHNVGTGVHGIGMLPVLALADYQDGLGRSLAAGGGFDQAGSVNTYHLAKWNGTQWGDVGGGLDQDSYVYALHSFKSALYVGGYIYQVGTHFVDGIARWIAGSSLSTTFPQRPPDPHKKAVIIVGTTGIDWEKFHIPCDNSGKYMAKFLQAGGFTEISYFGWHQWTETAYQSMNYEGVTTHANLETFFSDYATTLDLEDKLVVYIVSHGHYETTNNSPWGALKDHWYFEGYGTKTTPHFVPDTFLHKYFADPSTCVLRRGNDYVPALIWLDVSLSGCMVDPNHAPQRNLRGENMVVLTANRMFDPLEAEPGHPLNAELPAYTWWWQWDGQGPRRHIFSHYQIKGLLRNSYNVETAFSNYADQATWNEVLRLSNLMLPGTTGTERQGPEIYDNYPGDFGL